MPYKMSSAICLNLDQFTILSSGNGLKHQLPSIKVVSQELLKSNLSAKYNKRSRAWYLNQMARKMGDFPAVWLVQ